ncbi:MAG: hypothetical protein DRO99_00470 [Candidatus Aenigmatarchaeota archaeon]|nr:MAG: hypothetical protein DRO99_00470 [Candidatus Aenigmarchaeota archaeon]
MEIPICQICKEPINNFVCLECLAKDISTWLPPGLSDRFTKFNDWFLDTFKHMPHTVTRHHIVCDLRGKGSVCLYCYVNEVFQWLMGEDKPVARRFRKLFSFGMRKGDFKQIIKSHAKPISEVEEMEKEEGICDECGEYSDELHILNGRWVCRVCWGV